MIDESELKRQLDYNPATGVFTWLVRKNGIKARIAGSLSPMGYWIIVINSKHYKAHRLAWLYMTGGWPNGGIDHENGIKTDNSWKNLREATASQNKHNCFVYKNNSLGIKGVSRRNNAKTYRAKIVVNRKAIWLGSYYSPEEASKAYTDAAIKYAREFGRGT